MRAEGIRFLPEYKYSSRLTGAAKAGRAERCNQKRHPCLTALSISPALRRICLQTRQDLRILVDLGTNSGLALNWLVISP
jgi:hypothetical protein